MRSSVCVALLSVLFVAACKEEQISLTDDQILEIFGAARSDAPPVIPRSVTECFHVITTEGQRTQEAIAMQAMCRDELGRMLARQDVIPNLSLDALARREFATQLTTVSEKQNIGFEAWQEEQRAVAEAERLAAQAERLQELALELETRREQAAEARTAFHERIGALRDGCDAFRAAIRELNKAHSANRIAPRGMPRGCHPTLPALTSDERDIERQYETVMGFELPETLGVMAPSLPNVIPFDYERYDQMQQQIDERLLEIEEALEAIASR